MVHSRLHAICGNCGSTDLEFERVKICEDSGDLSALACHNAEMVRKKDEAFKNVLIYLNDIISMTKGGYHLSILDDMASQFEAVLNCKIDFCSSDWYCGAVEAIEAARAAGVEVENDTDY